MPHKFRIFDDMENMLFINGNVSSSKNGRVFNTVRKRSFDSKSTQKFKKASKNDWKDLKDRFLEMIKDKEKPYKIGFHFVRDSRRKYDWINPVQTVQDQMVHYEWIEDDNVTEIIPFPFEIDGAYSSLDKENPGCYIKIF